MLVFRSRNLSTVCYTRGGAVKLNHFSQEKKMKLIDHVLHEGPGVRNIENVLQEGMSIFA